MATMIELESVMFYKIYSDRSYESLLNTFMGKFCCDKNRAMELVEYAKNAVEENEPRRKFVVSYLHYTGENYKKLTNEQMYDVYCQADGFGERTRSQLLKLNGGWDWSHVRDSTIDGWKRMEKALNDMGFENA